MVSDLVSQNINIFLRNTVKVTGVVVFMFSLSWQLSLVTFMGFPIIMMVSNIYGKYYKVGAIWSPSSACVCFKELDQDVQRQYVYSFLHLVFGNFLGTYFQLWKAVT